MAAAMQLANVVKIRHWVSPHGMAPSPPSDGPETPTSAGGDAAEPDMRRRIINGFAWSMMAVAIMQVSQIVFGLVLVRLLSPHDYGLAGMALIFQSLVLAISDLSMGAALVQRREITETDRSTVFWTSAFIGTLLTLIGVAVSGPLAAFYGQPAVQPLFAAVSVTFVLVALQTTPASIMQREMRFRLLGMRSAAGVVVGALVGVTAAALGAGAWALIAQQISASACGTLLLWACSRWRPRFTFSRESLRDLGSYGLNLFGSNVLAYAKNNADNLLVGRMLGSAALGVYAVAYNLMFLPLARLIIPIQDTLFPAYSRWQDDRERLAGAWLRVLRFIGAVLTPALLGVIVVAPDFVHVVLGNKWHAAVPVLQLLAVVALAQCLAQLGQRVLGAVDRTEVILRFSICEGCMTVAAFAVGVQWGVVGVAVAYLVVSLPLQIVFVGLTARTVGVSAVRLLRALSGVAAATAVMLAACEVTRLLLLNAHVGPAPRFVLVVVVGILTYAPACFLLEPRVVREIRDVRSRRPRAQAVPVTT